MTIILISRFKLIASQELDSLLGIRHISKDVTIPADLFSPHCVKEQEIKRESERDRERRFISVRSFTDAVLNRNCLTRS